jgi:hypothetical protein
MKRPLPKSIRLLFTAGPALCASLACGVSISYSQSEDSTPVVPVTRWVMVTQVVSREATPKPPESLPFTVYADQGWQNTGIWVSPEDSVAVRYVSGKWTGGIGKGNWYDGRGDLIAKYKCAEQYRADLCDEPMPNVYNGTLVGRVGGYVLEIGNYLEFIPREDGDLYLRMNDHDEGLFDNEGSIKVEITISR